MNDKCFEPGIIQAFLDGETAPELSFKVTDHAAACDKCALLIAEAEEENAQVFAMLDREMNSLVPTQRLWNSITVAIAEEKSRESFWDKARGAVFALFANPSIAVAASVLVVAGLFAAVWSIKPPVSGEVDVAANSPVINSVVQYSANQGQPDMARVVDGNQDVPALDARTPIQVKETNHSPEKLRKLVANADYRPAVERPKAEYAVDTYLPGEESYIRTIAGLKENVDGRKDMIMDPSARMSFERDLAVVNDSIKKMKDVVRKNPKNQAARQVLYSSYQNKIDLLNSVVEREELMAALQ